MKPQTRIKLNQFQPRFYQVPMMDAIFNKGYRRVMAILPRRAGKDITALNICLRQCIQKPCVVYYVFPTYSQAKKVIWDSVTNDGFRILSYIPDEITESKNSQEMKIRFKNGSLIQLVGSDNYDSLMGTNPQGVVFSEYALQDPRAYQYIRPILTANEGWALFISTPRGKNHLWELYQIAQYSPEWFAYKMTVDDTKHIPLREIMREKEEGIMSEDLIQQEYYTSFEMGVEGAYYAKYLDKMRLDGRIGVVPYETSFPVHTVWDLGVSKTDTTAIIFFQVIGQTIRLIDCYENNRIGIPQYVKMLDEKKNQYNWMYGKHFGPHDMNVLEFGTGLTRIEQARNLGIKFEAKRDNKTGQLKSVLPMMSIMDGIEAVRTTFSKMWIDEVKCEPLLKALENYRSKYDPVNKIYSTPVHDWASHFADAMRYLCMSLGHLKTGASPEDIDRNYREAMYGDSAHLPAFFRD